MYTLEARDVAQGSTTPTDSVSDVTLERNEKTKKGELFVVTYESDDMIVLERAQPNVVSDTKSSPVSDVMVRGDLTAKIIKGDRSASNPHKILSLEFDQRCVPTSESGHDS